MHNFQLFTARVQRCPNTTNCEVCIRDGCFMVETATIKICMNPPLPQNVTITPPEGICNYPVTTTERTTTPSPAPSPAPAPAPSNLTSNFIIVWIVVCMIFLMALLLAVYLWRNKVHRRNNNNDEDSVLLTRFEESSL